MMLRPGRSNPRRNRRQPAPTSAEG